MEEELKKIFEEMKELERIIEEMRVRKIDETVQYGAKREDVEKLEATLKNIHPLVGEALHAMIEDFGKLIGKCGSKEERMAVLDTVTLWAKIQGDMIRQPKEANIKVN